MPRTQTRREYPLVSISPFGKDFRAVLVFPEPYSVASSNLAFHQIYRIIGQHPRWSCERAVVEPDEPVRTIEGRRPLNEFDLIAFTVPFEFGYLNVIQALDESGIPLLASQRCEGDPLVVMGGIAPAANPAVMAPFVDLFLLGEGEASLPLSLDRIASLLEESHSRPAMLEAARNLPGAYVPMIHGEQPEPISYARVQDMDAFPPCSAWLTPETEFDNTFLFEISRGCPCGCRFCMIRLSQKPLRAVSVERIEELVDELPDAVPASIGDGVERPRIGLVGAAVASHPDFEEICRRLRDKGWEITASAIEIDKVTDGILDLLASSQKTLTLAPERGIESERFRLGKRISDEHLIDVARRASALGMPRLKMYFVCGIVAPEFYGAESDRPGAEIHLPAWLDPQDGPDAFNERIFTHEADTVVNLVERIAEAFRPEGKPGTIGVTCSPFIPKPHTPWAGWPMATEKGLKSLDHLLRKRLGRIPRARYHSFSAWEALFQGILSQGGQSLAPVLVEAVRQPGQRKVFVRQILESGLVDLHNRRWRDKPAPWAFVRL
jgi:radical SAM superfamily enzyme YgiQ (UPF0313 family)